METIFSTSQFAWGHEVSQGMRMVPPTPMDLIDVTDEEGNPVIGPDGNPVRRPKPGWQPEFEEVSLDTIVVVDQNPETQNSTVFKLAFDKVSLSHFLARFAQCLDADGRNILRTVLNEASDIAIATPEDIRKIRGSKA